MKRKVFALLVLLLVLTTFGLAKSASPSDTLAEKIQKASALILDSEKSEDKHQGSLLLVESIDLASAGGSFPAGFRDEVSGALQIFRQGSFLDQQAGDKLRKAYTLLNSGKPFQMPAEISSIEQAVEYGRRQIQLALAQVNAGKNAAAVKPLLEFILMVITPMEARG